MGFLPGLAMWFALATTVAAVPAATRGEDRAPQVSLTVGRPVFSPNGDGVLDLTAALVTVDVPAALTLEVLDPAGAVVRTIVADGPVQPGETRVNWRGLDDQHRVVPDGEYTIRATLTDETGAGSAAEAPVIVDTSPPVIRWRSIAPQPVLRTSERVTISFRADGASRGRLLVTDLGGAVVHRDSWGALDGVIDRTWNLHTLGGERVPPGLYRVVVTERDQAGNVATSEPRTLRDVHPVVAKVVTSVEGAGDRVALTFDDCNSGAAWAAILDALAAADAKATFFCPGRQVLASPALARRTVLEGHGVGSHGWDHHDLTTLGASEIGWRLERDEAAWWRTTGAMAVPFLRPPYGALDEETRRVAGSTGYAWIALWNVDPRDWTQPGASAIASRVLAGAHSGSIVVLHVKDQTAAALPAILRGLRARGLRAVTMFELVSQATGVNPGRVPRMPV